MRKVHPLLLGTLILGSLLASGPARADDPLPRCHDPGGREPAGRLTVVIENGRRIFRYDGVICVPGEIQRPYPFSVSGRSGLGYTYLETPVHFVREVVTAVRRAPF